MSHEDQNRHPEDRVGVSFALDADLNPEDFPTLYNLSAGFMFKGLPVPQTQRPPECVYLPVGSSGSHDLETHVAMAEWNRAWMSGHLRHDVLGATLPKPLKWLKHHPETNFYLLPRTRERYFEFAPLYHMLPFKVLQRFGLPLLKRGIWPYSIGAHIPSPLPSDFHARLQQAFAFHIWRHIDRGSAMRAFGASDPIRVLAHSLNYWAPFAQMVAEECMSGVTREDWENQWLAMTDDQQGARELVLEPFKGGYVWNGEAEALNATQRMVQLADQHGRLRGIIDAIRSSRVEDDFSSVWSNAREDFERKLFKKRSKVKVTFVELTDAVPVHGPESEVIDRMLYEDFLAILDPKERSIVVLLSSGITKVGAIAKNLGYANHSPVSKALTRIRTKAQTFLN